MQGEIAVHKDEHGDIDGSPLVLGDIVEIVNMDDDVYGFLIGLRGVVHWIAEEGPSVIVLLDNSPIAGISTQQYRLRKVV